MDTIEDIRTEEQFRITTFSKYKRVDVKKEWLNSMIKRKIEPCCYWTTELICSGLFVDLWELILFYYAKYIHVGNPKLPIYLDMRFQTFKKTAEGVPELTLRNHEEIRKLFTEIVCILCTSNCHHGYEIIQIPKEEGINKMRLKAPTIDFNKAFKSSDPKELFIPMNEFSFALYSKDVGGSCFWIEWLFQFTHKRKCLVVERNYSSKHKQDMVWLLWDTILLYANGVLIKKIIHSVLSLFSIAFVPAVKEKRRFLLYYAVSLCCEKIALDIEMISDKTILEQVYKKCSVMYKDIKAHQIN